MTDPRRPRDELADHLGEGDADLIATVLVKEVLPTLDRIMAEIAGMRLRLAAAGQALAETHAIYAHLQDLAIDISPVKAGRIGQQRLELWERFEKVLQKAERDQ